VELQPVTVWTIGHSTRELDDFLALLARESVRKLVDVRAFPVSRRYPHFDREPLAASLRAAGIGYRHAPELGGRRNARKDTPPSAWRNAGFRGYADYMTTPAFAGALDVLVDEAQQEQVTIMCAEAVHWRCHRNLISDALVARGHRVLHIGDSGVTAHALTSFAVIAGDGVVRYPPEPLARQLSLLDEA
jgi:uncharacterized protein (DUF488 family)